MKTIKAPKPGIYRGVPAEEYHAWDAVSNSQLTNLNKSPMHYMHFLKNPMQQTPAMKLGTAGHSMILEPDLYIKQYAVAQQCSAKTAKGERCKYPGSIKRASGWYCKTSGHDKYDGPAEDIETLTEEEASCCTGMLHSVMSHPAASKLLDLCKDREISLVWDDTLTGLTCKARLDGILEIGGEPVILDLKTGQDASLVGFTKSVYSRGYFRQAAYYAEGASKTGLIARPVPSVVFICVESAPPHAVGVRRLKDEVMEMGRNETIRLRMRLAECMQNNRWPAYSDGIEEVGIPRWAEYELGGGL